MDDGSHHYATVVEADFIQVRGDKLCRKFPVSHEALHYSALKAMYGQRNAKTGRKLDKNVTLVVVSAWNEIRSCSCVREVDPRFASFFFNFSPK